MIGQFSFKDLGNFWNADSSRCVGYSVTALMHRNLVQKNHNRNNYLIVINAAE